MSRSLDQIVSGKGLLVVKVGSSLLVDGEYRLRDGWMRRLVARLSKRPGPVVVVSSGAIALGRSALGLEGRPRLLAQAQAAAAVGQIHLAGAWANAWLSQGRQAAQILLTLGDLEQRPRYLNARATLETLLERAIVPVVNENDTVATEEIRFGDNDRLAARVSALLGANHLLLLSDVDGLYSADPTVDPNARHIETVDGITPEIQALAGSTRSDGVGTGGMASKLQAARIATEAGVEVILAAGTGDDPLGALVNGARHTSFHAARRPMAARKQWLKSLQQPQGWIEIDSGALAALGRGSSLLAAGVRAVHGEFARGELVRIHGPDGPVGQGLSAYRSDQARQIVGLNSADITEVLGEASRGPLMHRDDLVLSSVD